LFVISAFEFRENFLNQCKWRQNVRNVSVGYQLERPSGKHDMKYGLEMRRLFDVQSGASHLIRDQAGTYFKSSVSYTVTKNTKDDLVLPTRGVLLKASAELAGLGGDSHFLKSDFKIQNHWTPQLTRILTLTQTVKFGQILPLSGKPLLLADRFQQGGPTSVRGFTLNSLGPRQFSDSLGGTSFLEAGLQVSFPFLQSAAHFARAHAFVNAGLLGDVSRDKLESACKNPRSIRPSLSVGGGLMFKMAETARLELNFAVPLVKSGGIKCERGIQVGIGMEFL
jgi:outer membrane protein insertion porin family